MSCPLVAACLTVLLLAAGCDDSGSDGSGGQGGSSGSGEGGVAQTTTSNSVSGASGVTATGVTATAAAASSVASGDTSSSSSTGVAPLACSGADPSFAADVQPILTASCGLNNCHKGSHPDKGLDLTDGASWAGLVGVETEECNGDRTRVTPGDPAASYVVQKIRDEDLCGTSRRMPPPNRDMLPPDEIQIIVDWICMGAADD